MSDLTRIPIRAPRQWDPEWFQRWVYETLAPLIAAASGDPDVDGIADLLAATLLTASPSTLDNGRAIVGQAGVFSTVDHGVSLELRLEENGVLLGHLAQIPGLSVLGAPIVGDALQVQTIGSAANDTVLRRVEDVLDWGPLTPDMAPDGLWTYGKLQDVSTGARVMGKAAGAPGPMEELTLSEVLDFIGSAAQGDILYRGDSGWVRLPAGSDGQVLTLSGGVPVWADPDSLLQATYLTYADETGTLKNSRQLLAGTDINLDDAVAGQLTVNDVTP